MPRSVEKIYLAERSGYPPLEYVTERSGFVECFTERISAGGESHGLSRSGYPWHVFFHGAVYLTVDQTAQNRGISPRCTVAIVF